MNMLQLRSRNIAPLLFRLVVEQAQEPVAVAQVVTCEY